MASKTTNYGLNKHSPQDFYNVEARNENWDKIDEALAATDPTKITAKATPADGDGVMIADSADGGKAKRLLWSSVKAALGKLFVPLARKINGKTLSADVTLTGENIAVSTTDSTPISDAVKYRTNPNLLDNWYFGNPVNQRGQTEYTGNATYSIDRWWTQYDTTLSIVDGGIKIGGKWDVQQYFENTLPNATYTLSLLYKDRTGSAPLRLLIGNRTDGDIAQTESKNASGILSITFSTAALNKVNFGFAGSTDNSATIIAAKLELGDTQTLAHKEKGVWVLNEIPDFGEQLRRCQYYAFKPVNVKDYGRIASGIGMSGNVIAFNIPIPHMRNVAPVVTGIGNTCTFWDGMSIQSGTISSFNGTSNEYITLFVSSTSFSVTAGTPFHLLTADILISADL